VSGGYVCDAVPGQPSAEVCNNNVDDDCDGQVDELSCACPAGKKLCNGQCIPQASCCSSADCSAGHDCVSGACVANRTGEPSGPAICWGGSPVSDAIPPSVSYNVNTGALTVVYWGLYYKNFQPQGWQDLAVTRTYKYTAKADAGGAYWGSPWTLVNSTGAGLGFEPLCDKIFIVQGYFP
jgi:hypothetical protein